MRFDPVSWNPGVPACLPGPETGDPDMARAWFGQLSLIWRRGRGDFWSDGDAIRKYDEDEPEKGEPDNPFHLSSFDSLKKTFY
jgi:hypothetical protein